MTYLDLSSQLVHTEPLHESVNRENLCSSSGVLVACSSWMPSMTEVSRHGARLFYRKAGLNDLDSARAAQHIEDMDSTHDVPGIV